MQTDIDYNNASLNLVRMRNASENSCRETPDSNFSPENSAAYEIMWNNMVQSDRPQTTIRCMRTACCVTRATDTRSEYNNNNNYYYYYYYYYYLLQLGCYPVAVVILYVNKI